MKFSPYYILVAIAFGVSLFFACTADIELPVDPAHFQEQEQGPVCPELYGWCDNKAVGECYRPECGRCNRTDLWVEFCPYVSSSSERSSSSVGGSSSSLGGGSSSDDYSSSGGSSSSFSSSSSVAISSSSSAIPPTLSDCKLPSTYVYKGEKVEGLVQIENDNGSCTGITYNPANYPSSASNTPQTFSTKATVTCGSVSLSKDCTGLNIAAVANNYLKFEHEGGTKEPITGGTTTVIEVLDGYDRDGVMTPVKKIGCENNPAGQGKISFKLNGGSVNEDYWVSVALPSYTTNGNRILLEVTSTNKAQCIVQF